MKKYTIIHTFTAKATIEVLAETKEEAFEKAAKNQLDLADYDFELENAEIGHEEDVENLDDLISQAESIIKNAEEEVILNPWPIITTEYWNGDKMQHSKQRMFKLFWDEEAEEIGFNTEENAGDFLLEELPETEQYEICKAIIGLDRKEVQDA